MSNLGNVRTDLAIEAHEYITQTIKQQDLDGVEIEEFDYDDIKVKRVKINNLKAAEQMGKEMGNYVTLEIPTLRQKNSALEEKVSQVFAKELNFMVNQIMTKDKYSVLIVGLGNWNVTPDALGPKVVENLLITRHLKELMPENISDEEYCTVCAIAPGVLGITGIETSEIIESIVGKIQPDLVIAVDALAARNITRLNTTIQIADTGIHPGSGVGNKRKGITKEILGIPVIAIGVPTVVDAVTLTNDTIDMVIDTLIKSVGKGGQFYQILKELDREEKQQLIKEVLGENLGPLIVSPKEIDRLMIDMGEILAGGINAALHPVIGFADATKHLY
ncbi:GPR endopeptidase [Anaerobranca gottschalkii]|uniref:Germination protease n=1 Tax=Anaerobranca gottschalkii DSM 13577 TaxID=1120990 RepID=A0A1H9YC06_9FIRM|nr:GPR endopeptidase [Anaerobranca gottschalkii]SES66492.1 spore protease [Anaerobranca gottschalkii DSM 13577]